jgi:hypothetical protein
MASVHTVTVDEATVAGNVLGALACNFLAGSVHASWLEKTALDKMPRSLRNQKGAIKYLMEQSAQDIRAAWKLYQMECKSFHAPTLQAMATACKAVANGDKAKPMTFKDKVAEILGGSNTPAKKVELLKALLEGGK